MCAFGTPMPIHTARTATWATDTTPAGLIPLETTYRYRDPRLFQHQHARARRVRVDSRAARSDFAWPGSPSRELPPTGHAAVRRARQARPHAEPREAERPAPARDMATPAPRARSRAGVSSIPPLGVRAPTSRR